MDTLLTTTEKEQTLPYVLQLYKEWSEKGIEKGIEIGTEKGIEIGTEKGIEKGIEIGTEKGIEKGIEIGTEKGIEIGTEKAISFFMKKNPSLTNEQVADMFEVSVETVQKIREKLK